MAKEKGKAVEPLAIGPADWTAANMDLVRPFIELPDLVFEDDAWMDLYDSMLADSVETAWATFLCLLHTIDEAFPSGMYRDEALMKLWVHVVFTLLGRPDCDEVHDRLLPDAERRWPLLTEAFAMHGVPMWRPYNSSPIERRRGRDNPYSGMSTPMIKGRLFDLTKQMHLRPIHKSTRLAELIQWTMTELPDLAPNDPRTQRAVDLAVVLWENSRDIGG